MNLLGPGAHRRSCVLMLFFVAVVLLGFTKESLAQMRKIYDLPPVQYPSECLANHVEGTVVLRFHVTRSGEIKDIQVTKTVAACPQFTTAALRAVKNARVYPLPPGVHLLQQSIEVPITFSMEESPI